MTLKIDEFERKSHDELRVDQLRRAVEDAIVESRERDRDRQNARNSDLGLRGRLRQSVAPLPNAAEVERLIPEMLAERMERLGPNNPVDAPERVKQRQETVARIEFMSQALMQLRQGRNQVLVRTMADEGFEDAKLLAMKSLDDQAVYPAVQKYADNFLTRGEFAAALYWSLEALGCWRDTANPPHPHMIDAMLLAADARAGLGEPEVAAVSLEEGLAIFLAPQAWSAFDSYGGNPRALRALVCQKRAELFKKAGKSVDADWCALDATRPPFDLRNEGNVKQLREMMEKADALLEEDNLSEAVESYVRARAMLEEPLDEMIDEVVRIDRHLGDALRDLGKPIESLHVAREALAVTKLVWNNDDTEIAASEVAVGAAQRDVGDLAGAQRTLQSAMEKANREIKLDPEYSDLASGDRGRAMRAELRRREDFRAATIASAEFQLGLLREKQGRLDEAKALLMSALERREENHGTRHRWTEKTRRELNRLSNPGVPNSPPSSIAKRARPAYKLLLLEDGSVNSGLADMNEKGAVAILTKKGIHHYEYAATGKPGVERYRLLPVSDAETRCLRVSLGNDGTVVIQTYDSKEGYRSHRWENDAWVTMDNPPFGIGFCVTHCRDRDFILGTAYTRDYAMLVPTVFEKGNYRRLPAKNWGSTVPLSANCNGVIVGYTSGTKEEDTQFGQTSACLWTNGDVQRLDERHSDSPKGLAADVNDQDVVVGIGWRGPSDGRGCQWTEGNAEFIWSDGDAAEPSAINSTGDICGTRRLPNHHGFVFVDGDTYNLNDCKTNLKDWKIIDAHDINDRGEVLVTASASLHQRKFGILVPTKTTPTSASRLGTQNSR